MAEAQGLGVEGLPGAYLEAVADELPVFGVDGSLADFGSSVTLVVEERMADGSHMDAYLVGAARLQFAFHEGHEAEAFQHAVVRDRVLSFFRIVGYAEAQAVVGIAGDILVYGAFLLFDVAPDYRLVAALRSMVEELLRQLQLRFVVLRHQQQPARILVDSMNQNPGFFRICGGFSRICGGVGVRCGRHIRPRM